MRRQHRDSLVQEVDRDMDPDARRGHQMTQPSNRRSSASLRLQPGGPPWLRAPSEPPRTCLGPKAKPDYGDGDGDGDDGDGDGDNDDGILKVLK